MAQIKLQNIASGFDSVLFRNLSFTISETDRVGIVGDNGSGKTTLLRCIAGQLDPIEGTIIRSKGARIVFVEQTLPEHLLAQKLQQVVLGGIPETDIDAQAWRAEMLLDTFETPHEMREREMSQLSGGWKRIAMILRAWISDPDILIIDEPTNDLDLTKIMLLEQWLNEDVKRIPLILVSHDRRFLDRCTNHTLFLRPVESRLYAYPFSQSRELLSNEDRSIEMKKERELLEMQRLRKSAHNLRQIGVNNYSSAALRKSIQIAKRADSIEGSLPQAHIEQKRDIRLVSRDTHAKRIIGIKNLTIRRPDGVALFLIGQLDIYPGDRIVVLGRNGTGKTQFVHRLQAGFMEPTGIGSDELDIAPSVVLGYVDQAMTQLPDQSTLHDYLGHTFIMDDQRILQTLISAGFSRTQHTVRIAELSSGERARLALLALRLIVPSFYLMDEPTNNLDITGQEQLEAEILANESTSLLVSHDRVFVEHTGTRFLVVEGSGMLEVDSPDIFYRSLVDDIKVSQLVPNRKFI